MKCMVTKMCSCSVSHVVWLHLISRANVAIAIITKSDQIIALIDEALL